MRIWRLMLAIWLLAVIALAWGGAAFLAYNARHTDRIFDGVQILGVDVGGLTQEQALQRVRAALGPEQLPYLRLTTLERDWLLPATDLGAEFDLQAAVARAWRLGREGVFRQDMASRLRLLWRGYRLTPELQLDPGLAQTALQSVARQAGHPMQRAQLWVGGLQARADASQVGREVDLPATQVAIQEAFSAILGPAGWDAAPRLGQTRRQGNAQVGGLPVEPLAVPLAFRELAPPLTEVSGAQERVRAILSGPVMLAADLPELQPDGAPLARRVRLTVDEAVLGSWLTVGPGPAGLQVELDQGKMRALLQGVADRLARPPREARFDYDPRTQRLTALAPGQNGYALDVEVALERLAAAALQADAGGGRAVSLPVQVVPPRVSRADLEALLPLELVGEGTTSFAGSTPGRLQNIEVATARFHGLLIPPQSVFSLLSHLGLVTAANGYSESWIIYGNRTLLGPGGGVCQVGTTFFRAAFWGGYPIVARSPHAYRVGWYEPPVGLDAAVFQPSVDVQFQNDTDTPLLILTEVDKAASRLTFRLYGRGVGRKVTIEGPTLANPVPAPAPVIEEDPLLRKGERIQVESAHDGVDVTIYRVISQGGQVVARERYDSHYKAWPARYRVGP